MSELLCKKLPIDGIIDDGTLISWLEEQAKTWNLNYLLAHAEDGVIWGRFDSGKLTTAEQIFHQPEFNVDFPSLRVLTLQQCRIFGEHGEVLLWRTSETWRSRLVQDNSEVDKIPERQILWGTHGEKRDNFTLLRHGSQGFRHAVPFSEIELGDRHQLINPVRLIVHHYITYDDDGVARISLSRLVDLTTEKELNNASQTSQKSTGRS